jgi:hypothetical protein
MSYFQSVGVFTARPRKCLGIPFLSLEIQSHITSPTFPQVTWIYLERSACTGPVFDESTLGGPTLQIL